MTIPFLFVHFLSVAVASFILNTTQTTTTTTTTTAAESTLELCGITRPASCSPQATLDVCQCIFGYIEQLEPLSSRMQCRELLKSLVDVCHQSGCSACSTFANNPSWVTIASIAVAVVVVLVVALVVIKLYVQRRRLASRVDSFRAASASRADETRALIYEVPVPQYPPRV
jgi:hypothetical protein